ncbi:MAG: hypothetical protein K2X27_22130 [Candidatus Obscuribacterales bacterium]|nr:hypothetical protein [Candidatus Obscuribacterales bacterium]
MEARQESAQMDDSLGLAQIELFIKLGNMSELEPDHNFALVLELGNALIKGEESAVQEALYKYKDRSKLLFDHCEHLKRAFSHAGVSFSEPSIVKYETNMGQLRSALVISVLLEKAGKIVFVSADPKIDSYVHSFSKSDTGTVSMEAVKEDPQLLLKQISRLIRIPENISPPPQSHANAILFPYEHGQDPAQKFA